LSKVYLKEDFGGAKNKILKRLISYGLNSRSIIFISFKRRQRLVIKIISLIRIFKLLNHLKRKREKIILKLSLIQLNLESTKLLYLQMISKYSQRVIKNIMTSFFKKQKILKNY
jgi:hypothetical protein